MDGDEVKRLFEEIAACSDVSVEALEVEQDHLHCMVESEPRISPLTIVRKLKQESTFQLWKTYGTELKRPFWKEKTFWSDGYFCCTIRNVSQEALRQYIENQGEE